MYGKHVKYNSHKVNSLNMSCRNIMFLHVMVVTTHGQVLAPYGLQDKHFLWVTQSDQIYIKHLTQLKHNMK